LLHFEKVTGYFTFLLKKVIFTVISLHVIRYYPTLQSAYRSEDGMQELTLWLHTIQVNFNFLFKLGTKVAPRII